MEDQNSEDQKLKFVSVYYHTMGDSPTKTDPGNKERHITELTLVSHPEVDQALYIPDYIFITTVSMILFCPLGIPAFRCSQQVRRSLKQKAFSTAQESSAKALQFALAAIVAFGLLVALVVLCVLLARYNNT